MMIQHLVVSFVLFGIAWILINMGRHSHTDTITILSYIVACIPISLGAVFLNQFLITI